MVLAWYSAVRCTPPGGTIDAGHAIGALLGGSRCSTTPPSLVKMAQIINPFLYIFTGASLLDGGWWQRSRCCDGAGSGNKAHFMDRDILKEIANVSIKAGEEEYILVER